jgi:A/G-specific adenine glycosylase
MSPDPDQFSDDLLSWYDDYARDLPWRQTGPGGHSNPYHVWISEVMLQQTGVSTVGDYFHRFIDRWPTIADLAKASQDEVLCQWAGLGYYARGRNLLKAAKKMVADFDGKVPNDLDDLLSLPGIGPYTAAAILAIAFDMPAAVVDGNIKRVIARLYAIRDPIGRSSVKNQIKKHVQSLTPDHRPGDFAESMMDLGSMVCTPRDPSCNICPVRSHCDGINLGIAGNLPIKKKKSKRPEKSGTVYAIISPDGDQLLLRHRPDVGLLGGMVELPTTDWTKHHTPPDSCPDFWPDDFAPPDWRVLDETLTHVFSHFSLTLTICVFKLDEFIAFDGHFWHTLDDLDNLALPTVMRKVIDRLDISTS